MFQNLKKKNLCRFRGFQNLTAERFISSTWTLKAQPSKDIQISSTFNEIPQKLENLFGSEIIHLTFSIGK